MWNMHHHRRNNKTQRSLMMQDYCLDTVQTPTSSWETPPQVIPQPLTQPTAEEDPFSSVPEEEAAQRLLLIAIAERLKRDAKTPPPYTNELKSLETSNYKGFVSVDDASKTLKGYITIIEAFMGRQASLPIVHLLPSMFGDMDCMLAKMPKINFQDHHLVH